MRSRSRRVLVAAGAAALLLQLQAVEIHAHGTVADTTAAGRAYAASPDTAASLATLVLQDPPFTMRIGARVQVRYTHADPPDAGSTNLVHIRRGRLSLSGAAYERFNYAVQLELAGAAVRLLDANISTPLAPFATLWFGQGKAHFGRQQLTSSGNLHFVDRNIVDGRFSAGRQQGIALTGRLGGGLLEYGAGAYNGNGINQTANPNDRFMTTGRVVVMPFGAYSPAESAHDYPASPRVAVGVAGFNNSAGSGDDRVDVTRLNAEGAFKLRGLNLTAEFYREWAEPVGMERVTTNGWYAQAGYLLPGRNHEIAGRYAVVGAPDGVGGGLVETGLAHSYYFRAHSAKVQTDVRNVHDEATGSDHRELRVQFQLTL